MVPLERKNVSYKLNCRGKIVDLSVPKVMAVMNLSSESFSAVGRVASVAAAVEHAKAAVSAGAAIIDIGAEPTNPVNLAVGTVAEKQELAALLPVIQALVQEVDVPLSVDTSRPHVMEAAINAGAHMINDVRALRLPGALQMAATLSVPFCLMHMQHIKVDNTATLPTMPSTLPVMVEIIDFLAERIRACEAIGIARDRLVIDPGIGAGSFGKTTAQCLDILRQLPTLQAFDLPVMVGVSRKIFLGELLGLPVEERLAGSLAAAMVAVQQGAQIIRAHDVAQTVQVLTVIQELTT